MPTRIKPDYKINLKVPLFSYFQNACEHFSVHKALTDNKASMTYAEALHTVNLIYVGIKHSLGVYPNRKYLILLDKENELPLTILAVWKFYGCVIPLDVHNKKEFLNKVLDESQAEHIITSQQWLHKLEGLNIRPNVTVSLVEQLVTQAVALPVNVLESESKSGHLKYDYNSPAQVVYTSGTTGSPKGIVIPHRAFTHSYIRRYGFSDYDPTCNVLVNIFFIWECFRPLLRGGHVVSITDNQVKDPLSLLKLIKNNQITEILMTPTLMNTLLNYKHETIRQHTGSIRTVWMNGETVNSKLRTKLIAAFPESVNLLNTYSISETHDVCNINLREEIVTDEGYCKVGRPNVDVDVRIFDENLNALDKGRKGEMYISGPGIALEYLKNNKVTSERFVYLQNKIWYKTGDLAIIHEDGTIEIQGRLNFFVKIRGYSVHLSGVENAINKYLPVSESVVVEEEDRREIKRLVAYYVPDKTFDQTYADKTEREISSKFSSILKEEIAHYMVPAAFIKLDKIPQTFQGKTNYKILPKSEYYLNSKENDESQAEFSETELQNHSEVLKVLFAEIVGIDQANINNLTDFFDLGADSLMVAKLSIRLSQLYNIEMSSSMIYDNSKLEIMADFVKNFNLNDVEYNMNNSIDKERSKAISDSKKQVSIKVGQASEIKGLNECSKVFITGSTGFLGNYLLYELLQQETVLEIYSLVRAKDAEEGLRRIKQKFSDNGLDYLKTKINFSKLKILPGSVEDLGPESNLSQTVEQECEFYFHCAASVNFIKSYDELHPTTVGGSANVLRMAAGNNKPLVHVSTNGIFPTDAKAKSEDLEIGNYVHALQDNYCLTKWVAETQLISAQQQGYERFKVVRPGNIGHPELRYPHRFPPQDYQYILADAIRALGCYPAEWTFECTPVDVLVRDILDIAKHVHLDAKVYNVVDDYNVLGDVLRGNNTLQLVDENAFMVKLKAAITNSRFHTHVDASRLSMAYDLCLDIKDTYLKDAGGYQLDNIKEIRTIENRVQKQVQFDQYWEPVFAEFKDSEYTSKNKI